MDASHRCQYMMKEPTSSSDVGDGSAIEHIGPSRMATCSEIVAELMAKRSVHTDPSISEEAMERVWGSQSWSHSRVFVSHRAEDKIRATEIANGLQEQGYRTFVAHDDIQPTREWRDEIVHALDTMTHFVALITERFHGGGWTDQEVGYAFCRKDVKRIFVKLSDADPEGLAAFEQAMPAGSNTAERIHTVLIEDL